MKIKFKETTVAAKAIRKKGTVHDIPDGPVADSIIQRGFGERLAPSPEPPADPPAPGAGAAETDSPGKKKKKRGEGGDDAA